MYIYLEILNLHVETYIEKLRASTIPWLTSNYASGAEKKNLNKIKSIPIVTLRIFVLFLCYTQQLLVLVAVLHSPECSCWSSLHSFMCHAH